MVVNHFLAGIILQVVFSFLGSAFYSTCTSRTKNCSTHNRGSKSMFSGITYLDLRCLEKVKLLKFVLPNGRLMVIYHGAKSRTTLKNPSRREEHVATPCLDAQSSNWIHFPKFWGKKSKERIRSTTTQLVNSQTPCQIFKGQPPPNKYLCSTTMILDLLIAQ